KQGRFVRPVRRRRMTTAMSVGSGWGLAMRPGALRTECGANRTHFPPPDGKGQPAETSRGARGAHSAAALLVLLLLAGLARVRGAHRARAEGIAPPAQARESARGQARGAARARAAPAEQPAEALAQAPE